MTVGDKMNKTKKIQRGAKKKEVRKVETVSSNDELGQLLTLIVAIVVILFLVYIISSILKGKDYSSIFDNSLETTEIQYDEVLVGTMLKQPEEEYYVLVIDDEDPYKSIFENYFSNYISLEYTTRMYKVDLGSIFNKDAKAEEASYSGKLRFNKSVLVKVVNGSIEEVIDDSSEIGNKIITMSKEIEEAS
jgi:hypothetical protein